LKIDIKAIHDMYILAMDAIVSGKVEESEDIQRKREEILLLDDKMRKAHIERVGKKKCNSKMTAPFNNILHDIDRMGNSCVNLVEMALSKTLVGLLLNDEID